MPENLLCRLFKEDLKSIWFSSALIIIIIIIIIIQVQFGP